MSAFLIKNTPNIGFGRTGSSTAVASGTSCTFFYPKLLAHSADLYFHQLGYSGVMCTMPDCWGMQHQQCHAISDLSCVRGVELYTTRSGLSIQLY